MAALRIQAAGMSSFQPVLPVAGMENSARKILLSPSKPSIGVLCQLGLSYLGGGGEGNSFRKRTVGNGAGTDGATVAIARFVGHDDDFLVVGDQLVAEDLGAVRTLAAVFRGVGEGVSKHAG